MWPAWRNKQVSGRGRRGGQEDDKEEKGFTCGESIRRRSRACSRPRRRRHPAHVSRSPLGVEAKCMVIRAHRRAFCTLAPGRRQSDADRRAERDIPPALHDVARGRCGAGAAGPAAARAAASSGRSRWSPRTARRLEEGPQVGVVGCAPSETPATPSPRPVAGVPPEGRELGRGRLRRHVPRRDDSFFFQ